MKNAHKVYLKNLKETDPKPRCEYNIKTDCAEV
jgi:hypothetical protein